MVLWKSFLSNPNFWAKNVKIKFLKKIIVFRVVFFQIEVQVISNPSSRLEKTPKPLNVCLSTIFYDIF